jgi:hypothetical protein
MAVWKAPTIERDRPLPPRGAERDGIVEREGQGRCVAGRVGVADRAADRPLIADLDVADALQAVASELEPGAVEGLGVRRQGAHRIAAIGRRAMALQLRQAADVDEPGGAGEAQLHEGQQAHATGQHLGVTAGEGSQGVLERGRAMVVERCRDHAWPPFADSIAPHTFWAV